MPQPGMVMQQQQVVQMGPPPGGPKLAILAAAQGFYVRQKVQWLEEIVGFEQANKYKVYAKPDGVQDLQEHQVRFCFFSVAVETTKGAGACVRERDREKGRDRERRHARTCVRAFRVGVCVGGGALYSPHAEGTPHAHTHTHTTASHNLTPDSPILLPYPIPPIPSPPFLYCNAQITQLPEIFKAHEESDMCARQCCAPQHELKIHVRNAWGQEILCLVRARRGGVVGEMRVEESNHFTLRVHVGGAWRGFWGWPFSVFSCHRCHHATMPCRV
jgi:hypothetical protein